MKKNIIKTNIIKASSLILLALLCGLFASCMNGDWDEPDNTQAPFGNNSLTESNVITIADLIKKYPNVFASTDQNQEITEDIQIKGRVTGNDLGGNIYKQINGVNLWGDGTMNGGQPYIAENFSFNEESHGGNYQPAGFTYTNTNGYVSAFGYGSEKYDWLFLPTAVNENNADNTVPVGDRVYCRTNATGTYTLRFGGSWETGDAAGGFSWYGYVASGTANKARTLGGRLLYVPTAVI